MAENTVARGRVHFGKWLRWMIEDTALTFSEFCRRALIPRPTIQRWIDAACPPMRGCNVVRLAKRRLGSSAMSSKPNWPRLGQERGASRLSLNCPGRSWRHEGRTGKRGPVINSTTTPAKTPDHQVMAAAGTKASVSTVPAESRFFRASTVVHTQRGQGRQLPRFPPLPLFFQWFSTFPPPGTVCRRALRRRGWQVRCWPRRPFWKM